MVTHTQEQEEQTSSCNLETSSYDKQQQKDNHNDVCHYPPPTWYNDAYSPFHLSPTFLNKDNSDNKSSSLSSAHSTFRAYIRSSLSDDGGMHRIYNHTLCLSFPSTLLLQNQTTTTMTAKAADQTAADEQTTIRTRLNGIVDILLPLNQGTYIDVDDPFPAFIHSKQQRGECHVTPLNNKNSDSTTVQQQKQQQQQQKTEGGYSCSVDLILADETSFIDVEQPAFVSAQHVVAFRLSLRDYSTIMRRRPSDKKSADYPSESRRAFTENEQGTELKIDFSTVLHTRYPSPIVKRSSDDYGTIKGNRDDTSGQGQAMTPFEERKLSWRKRIESGGYVNLYVPTPVVYSGQLFIDVDANDHDDGWASVSYSLDTSVISAEQQKDAEDEPVRRNTDAATTKTRTGGIIMLQAAAGYDSDYWLVIIVTMLASVMGAFIMLADLSRVSIWC